jgi:uncharacterized protein (DUF1501 family)
MNDNILVVLFLRGGMDGLSAVVPYGDDDYHRARPTIGLGTPQKGLVDLDGYFGLHPALKSLEPLWKEGKMGIHHAVGSQDQTRSHFEAMSAMERGLANDKGAETSGWLARYLNAVKPEKPSAVRALAFAGVTPDSLRGARDATTIQSLNDLTLRGTPAFAEKLARLYAGDKTPIGDNGRETLAFLKTLERVKPNDYQAQNGAIYNKNSTLAQQFQQTACLIRANVGMQIAFLERGGWDTHVAQGGVEGYLALQLTDIAQSLAAFSQDMGPELSRVTVIAMTEFGRRVGENSGLGTDHGRGSCLFWIGGDAIPGKVQGTWPGLAPSKLEGPGDLRVTTDYRTLLSQIVTKRLGGESELATIFPHFSPDNPLEAPVDGGFRLMM